MNIENSIIAAFKELEEKFGINLEYQSLYTNVSNNKLKEIFSTLHYNFTLLFKSMNERLPTDENGAHFWAEQSRQLITIIEITIKIYYDLKNTKYSFEIEEYYNQLIYNCRNFLCNTGGSSLPPNMAKIQLYYTIPIFLTNNTITIDSPDHSYYSSLKPVGSGSYADVYKYKDLFYNKYFALKRAKKKLSDKELERFKLEFSAMQTLSSPYILEVYNYNNEKNEYIMEYINYTLYDYIKNFNSTLDITSRKKIVYQIFRAFKYLHSKNILHRDISPKNILLKCYDDVNVIKLSDFGLIKIPDSTLTSFNTEFKGYFNDPNLIIEGFNNYNILHETYAITRLVYFVMTGKYNTNKIQNVNLKTFITKGLNSDKSKRYQNVDDMLNAFKSI